VLNGFKLIKINHRFLAVDKITSSLQEDSMLYRILLQNYIRRMSYLRYLCLFTYSGVQHILCCVFVLFFFVSCTIFDCPFGIL
jgi:hypothetical protein